MGMYELKETPVVGRLLLKSTVWIRVVAVELESSRQNWGVLDSWTDRVANGLDGRMEACMWV